MQLNITTDYAIRLILYLATVRRAAGSAEISDAMSIPRGQFGAISKPLRKHGIIDTQRGTNGGYLLAKRPEDISLHEIINIMEPITRINRCLEPGAPCSRHAADTYPVRKFYVHVQECLDTAFANKTIASLLADA